jgi:hypothetical protein
MRHEKLIKVIPLIDHQNSDVYPSGGLASQIIVKEKIQCQVVQFLKSNEVFRDVWA